MSSRVLRLALLGLALCIAVQGRELQARAPAETGTSCTPSWTATMDEILANTLYSGPEGAGQVTVTLVDEETLYFSTALKAGVKVKSLQIQASDSSRPTRILDLPLATQMSNETEGFLSSNDTVFSSVVEMLKYGKAIVAAEVAAPRHSSLVGALYSNCDDQVTELVVRWSTEDSLPACNVPDFSEPYNIPDDCLDFPQRVMESCGLPFEDVLVASAHDEAGNLIGYGISGAACLPRGCNPCADITSQDRERPEFWGADPLHALLTQPASCSQPGFESLYSVPESCDNLADRMLDFCGVRLEDVIQASAGSADGLCLPMGCDPCAPYPNVAAAAAEMEQAAPSCAKSYLFTKAYSIPAGCGYFPDQLKQSCGLEAEAIAEASGMDAYPAFAGFGEGKTVCLPESCDPCSQTAAELAAQISLTQAITQS